MVNLYCIRPRVWKSCAPYVQKLLRTGQGNFFFDVSRGILRQPADGLFKMMNFHVCDVWLEV